MTRRIIASLAAAGVAILASCSQDQRPSAPLPTEASLARTPAPPTCSFTTIGQDAKNYFTNSSGPTKDPVFALIDAMSAAYKTGGASGATSAGFDVLRRYADVVGTADLKTTTTAANLSLAANNVLLCMSVSGFTYAVDQFTSAFGTSGLFAVRADTEATAAVARSGLYGVEPTTGDWPIKRTSSVTTEVVSPSGEALFYGSPVTSLDPKFDDPLGGNTVVDINTLPTPLTFSPKIRVGFCDMTSSTARILHLHAGDPAVVLPGTDDPTFCSGVESGSLEAPSSMFASAARTLGSWFAPKPAYAASRSMMFLFFGGGTVGGLSEIGPVQVQDTIIIDRIVNAKVSDTTLATDTLPHAVGDPAQFDTTTSQFKTVVSLQLLTKAGKNPLANVAVELTVIGNKGSFAASGTSAVTDGQGIARFPNLRIDKAGGYTISAKAADAEGFVPNFVATSNLFNISGQ